MFPNCDHIDPDKCFYNELSIPCNYITIDSCNHEFQTKSWSISILHINCRSLRKHFDQLEHMLDTLNLTFDIVAVTETWLTEFDDINLFKIKDYKLETTHRKGKIGGGVAVYIRESCVVSVLHHYSLSIIDGMESLTLQIVNENQKYNIVCIYRPPTGDLEKFYNCYLPMMEELSKKTTFVCGDLNLDLLSCGLNHTVRHFVDHMYSMGLFPLITKPTRITTSTATLIDNIWTNKLNVNNCVSGLLIDDLSDHLPIFYVDNVCTKSKTKENSQKMYYNFEGEKNVCMLFASLLGHDWYSVLNETNVNVAYSSFLNVFKNYYDKCCPLKTVGNSSKKSMTNVWITNGLKNSCRKKNLLYKKYLTSKTMADEIKYKAYRNKLTALLRTAEKTYYQELLNKSKGDSKKTWDIINNVLRKNPKKSISIENFQISGDKIIGKTNISNAFNDHFVHIGSKLQSQLPLKAEKSTNFEQFLKNKNKMTMFLQPVSESDVINIVNKFKNKNSTDLDGIKMSLVKKIILAIATPLTHIINLSLETGIFPDHMKYAKVIPVHKSGVTNEFNNYRPISILTQFSKVLEKVFYKQLISFLNKNHILSSSQYGFRTNHSTSQAINDILEKLTDSLDKGFSSIGVFIDLRKAFDTVDHKILISKLEHYGIRGHALTWLKSYLADRFQCVLFNAAKSGNKKITTGVPQGSILGPLLFLLFINDLCDISNIINFLLFADDTNLFGSDKSMENLTNCFNRELKVLNSWFLANKMYLNIEKSNFMVFGHNTLNTDIKLNINEHELKQVECSLFLGVKVDKALKFKEHISHIEKKVAKGIGVLYRLKDKLNERSLLILYNTLIYPYLNYCSDVWGQTANSNLQKLIILQKKAIRIVSGLKYNAHTGGHFKRLKCLKVEDIIKFNTCLLVFKGYMQKLPTELQKRFVKNKDRETYGCNTRSINDLYINKAKKELKHKCISVSGIILFNRLPDYIKISKTENTFKKSLKKFLLESYV